MLNTKDQRAKSFASVMASLILLAAIAGSASASQNKARQSTDPSRSQSYMEREVGHQLRLLPYFSVFDNLEYRVNGYRVTLSGEVSRPSLKSDAEHAVRSIEGVESIMNNIKVLPTSPADDRMRMATYRAIFGHSVLSRYAMQAVPPIHIIVESGHVKLVGVVANEMDKNVAGIQAKGVSGVFSVTNELRVERK